jgi:hypothetical protein
MDDQQLKSFVKSVVETMEHCDLTEFSNNPITDQYGQVIGYDFGYSTMQNTPTFRGGNIIAQDDFRAILHNYLDSQLDTVKGSEEEKQKAKEEEEEEEEIFDTVYNGDFKLALV